MRFQHLAVADDFGNAIACADQRTRGQPDERVAPETLAAHHGLQQERIRAAALGLRELQVQRERRFEVGERLGDQRDAVVALVGEGLKFEFGHVPILFVLPVAASGAGPVRLKKGRAVSARHLFLSA
jgi:hypothetical protein